MSYINHDTEQIEYEGNVYNVMWTHDHGKHTFDCRIFLDDDEVTDTLNKDDYQKITDMCWEAISC